MGLPSKSSCTERTWADRSLWSCGWLCQYLLTATKKVWDERETYLLLNQWFLKPGGHEGMMCFSSKSYLILNRKHALKQKKKSHFFSVNTTRNSSHKHENVFITHISFQTCNLSYFEHKRKYFEEPNSYWSPLTFIVGKEILWKSMGTINCLSTSILHNIFFHVLNYANFQVCNDMRLSKGWLNFHVWVNYAINNNVSCIV